MTNKIIIDGVNVAECDMKCTNSDCGLYYAEVYNTSDELKYGFKCEDNPDCYYKQLQRLQAELKNEKEVEKILNKTLNDTASKLDKIFATNKKQQEIIDTYKLAIYEGKEIIDDYKQALEEIREIADLINKANCNYVKESEKILDKISEVLND